MLKHSDRNAEGLVVAMNGVHNFTSVSIMNSLMLKWFRTHWVEIPYCAD